MQQESQETLTPKERSRVWWRGFWKGLIQGIPIGLAVAVGAAALLAFVAIPLFPPLAAGVGSFLTWPAVLIPEFLTSILPAIPVTGALFFPVPLMLFNTALTMAGNALASANGAVGDYQQKVDHAANVERLRQLEGRQYVVEQVVSQQANTSKIVESVLARGPRNVQNFVSAEEARAADVAKAKVLQ